MREVNMLEFESFLRISLCARVCAATYFDDEFFYRIAYGFVERTGLIGSVNLFVLFALFVSQLYFCSQSSIYGATKHCVYRNKRFGKGTRPILTGRGYWTGASKCENLLKFVL